MGRFWLNDDFIEIEAKKLSIYEQMVYVALTRFANKQGETFVGVRRLASCLNINKDTVAKAIKGLVASGLVGHYKVGKHRVSGLKLSSVRNEPVLVSDTVGPKEEFKEVLRKELLNQGTRGQHSPAKEKLRKMFKY